MVWVYYNEVTTILHTITSSGDLNTSAEKTKTYKKNKQLRIRNGSSNKNLNSTVP